MKYMGHKGKLLPVLGEILIHESRGSSSIADPFCGSGAVSWFLATQTDKTVISGDLQSFAVARAASVIERTEPTDASALLKQWTSDARSVIEKITSQFPNAERSINPRHVTAEDIRYVVSRSRTFCEAVLPPVLNRLNSSFPMTRAYGGHYFSPLQAIELDALRQTMPKDPALRRAALGALVETASKCAASPGHTAQPFQPTESAARYILEAWNRDVWTLLEQSIASICSSFARVRGTAEVGGFEDCISKLSEGDLVFADPPYSDVHYSRFYHVLETLTVGREVVVAGTGRYPPFSDRPASNFSRKGKAKLAAKALIESCVQRRTNLVLTFPHDGASNGLTTGDFIALAEGSFSSVETHQVTSQFSTLGGNLNTRGGRKECTESIVCFRH